MCVCVCNAFCLCLFLLSIFFFTFCCFFFLYWNNNNNKKIAFVGCFPTIIPYTCGHAMLAAAWVLCRIEFQKCLSNNNKKKTIKKTKNIVQYYSYQHIWIVLRINEKLLWKLFNNFFELMLANVTNLFPSLMELSQHRDLRSPVRHQPTYLYQRLKSLSKR